jgi:hypothetical protein
MLCVSCSDLDLTQAASDVGAPHHNNYSDLSSSAESGCELCAAILRQHKDNNDVNEDQDEFGKIVCHFNGVGSFLYWQYQSRPKSEWFAKFEVCTHKGTYTLISTRLLVLTLFLL